MSVTCLVAPAAAEPSGDSPTNVFAQALRDGEASQPAPVRSESGAKVLQALRARSGSAEPIELMVRRLAKFKDQPNCGRVRFGLVQAATHVEFRGFGGEMNVCADGQPPLRICPERPGVLVPVDAVCAGGKPPIDTEEVAAAIRNATVAGGVPQEEMLRQWRQQLAAHAPASAASSGAMRLKGSKP